MFKLDLIQITVDQIDKFTTHQMW